MPCGERRRRTFTWVEEKYLVDQGVQPWSELPLWIPDASNGIFETRNDKAIAAGLTFRPLGDDRSGHAEWDRTRAQDEPMKAGLSRGSRAGVIDAMRRILHIDMDAFYASVEQRDNPSLRGKPLAVGGQPNRRGVVAAASYEARAFGVRSAMSMAKAVKLCPSLVIVPPDFSRYKAASTTIFAIYREVTPLVEPLSLDEAYLDVTENSWNEPLATTVAKRLKERIREATGLTASAGVAPNKFLAKIASGWKKPDGLTVIPPDRVEPFLQHLPVDALWGVGPVTAKKLRARGITRLVDVRAVDEQVLREAVGSMADWLKQLANGIDDRPVVADRRAEIVRI